MKKKGKRAAMKKLGRALIRVASLGSRNLGTKRIARPSRRR